MTLEEWKERLAASKNDPELMDAFVTDVVKDIAEHPDWRELAKFCFGEGVGETAVADAVAARNKAEATVARSKAMVSRVAASTPKPKSYRDVETALPRPLLSIGGGKSGAILTDGAVLVLAGEGGIGKSVMASTIARGMAHPMDEGKSSRKFGGEMFRQRVSGPVLYATFEDIPGVVASQIAFMHNYDMGVNGDMHMSEPDVHIMDMNEHPLFGPIDRITGDKGFYNQQPDRLPGWGVLWSVVRDLKPVLVVIDAATDAYVGDANQVPPVAAFLSDLRTEARKAEHPCGILLLAHSTKDTRGGKSKQKFDPYNPGNVAGSAAWTDKARGVLSLMWDRREDDAQTINPTNPGGRLLVVQKSNYGVTRVLCEPQPRRSPDGRIMGFAATKWEGANYGKPNAK